MAYLLMKYWRLGYEEVLFSCLPVYLPRCFGFFPNSLSPPPSSRPTAMTRQSEERPKRGKRKNQ